MTPEPNPIIEKIRKLQALAERAGSEAEAVNAAARVRELLEKHNLDIGAIQLEAEPGIERSAGNIGRRSPHLNIIGATCDSLFSVEHFMQGSGVEWHFVFVGLPANVEAACLTFMWLRESVESLLEGWKREKRGWITGLNRKDYNAFRLGCSARIFKVAEDQKQRHAPKSMELVHIGNAVAKRMIDAMQFESKYNPNMSLNPGHRMAYSEGFEQGDRVDIHGGRTSRMVKK